MQVLTAVTNIKDNWGAVEYFRNGLVFSPDNLQTVADLIVEILLIRRGLKVK